MKRGAFVFIFAVAAAFSLAACSGSSATGLDQMLYNATYNGQGTIRGLAVLPGSAPAGPLRFTMTLAQLGQNFSGTFSLTDTLARPIYSGGATGRATSAGADFTFVVPAPCAGTLYGSWTVSNGQISGSAIGRDCGFSETANNVQITFTNLVKQ